MAYDKANQLVSRQDGSGTTYYDYDKAGRMVRECRGSEVLAKYEYGYLDKVVAVERGGQRTEFYYNAKGMLVGKKLPSGEIEPWAWSGRALVMRGDTVYVNENHISGGVPVASRRMGSDDVTFYENDYLGNTTAVRSDGELQPVFSTPFGDSMGQDVTDRRFTGKPYDADLNAYVFPYRNYSVATSRWMSADPIGFPDGPNRHFYAPVPTIALDPLGLKIIFANGTSQATQDAVNNILGSNYGNDPNSAFNKIYNSTEQHIIIKDGAVNQHTHDQSGEYVTINPNQDVSITIHPDGGDPSITIASLESIIIHEVRHAYDHYNNENYDELRSSDGAMGDNGLEDLAMQEANIYRQEVGEDTRAWYKGLEDYNRHLAEL